MNIWANQALTDQVVLLWKEGLSATEIAAKHPPLTRNAVIGKISRLGLQRAATGRNIGGRPSPWTPDAVATLIRLVDAQYTSRQIGIVLGVSHAAVRKRMKRMGLQSKSPYAEQNAPRAKRKATWMVPRPHGPRAEPMQIVEDTPPPPGAKPWTERAFGECARPVSGFGADTYSCAQPTGGATYCHACRLIMFAGITREGLQRLDKAA
jgi:hypothetical protein